MTEFSSNKPKKTQEPDAYEGDIARWIFYFTAAAIAYVALIGIWKALGGSGLLRTLAGYPWRAILFGVKIGAVALSVAGIWAIARFVKTMIALRARLTAAPETPDEKDMTQDEKEIHRAWTAVTEQLDSANGSDWKLAVMSADAVMGEALEDMNIAGATMADRLKTLGESRRLRSYERLWDAHKVRNEIAHEPRRAISQEEARRVVEQYAETLKELGAM